MFSPHGTHGWQVTEPVSFAKDPSGHAAHVAAPEWFTADPTAHGVCSVLPVAAKKPGSVSVHSVSLMRLVAAEYEPSLQGIGALAPSGQ